MWGPVRLRNGHDSVTADARPDQRNTPRTPRRVRGPFGCPQISTRPHPCDLQRWHKRAEFSPGCPQGTGIFAARRGQLPTSCPHVVHKPVWFRPVDGPSVLMSSVGPEPRSRPGWPNSSRCVINDDRRDQCCTHCPTPSVDRTHVRSMGVTRGQRTAVTWRRIRTPRNGRGHSHGGGRSAVVRRTGAHPTSAGF